MTIELSRIQQTLLFTLYGKALDYRSKTPVLRPPLADYGQIPLRRFRVYCALLNRIPVARNMIRSLRYRFGPG